MAKAKKKNSPYVVEVMGDYDHNRPYLLAIDPASKVIGWALITLQDTYATKAGEVVASGVWVLKGETVFERLKDLIGQLVDWEYTEQIQGFAIERQWLGKNIQTALTIGRARGWVEAAFASAVDIRIWIELTPAEWKGEFTGNYKADKEATMETCRIRGIDITHVPKSIRDNTADAVGIGIVGYNRYAYEQFSRKQMGEIWGSS
jgi:crossover junction endodeoxyribonuclease RuvC